MKAYEAGTPAYFATPPVNLIRAYHTSLTQILKSGVSLQERFKSYVEAEEEWLHEGLETVRYDINAMDTLLLVTGPGRIEKVRSAVHRRCCPL